MVAAGAMTKRVTVLRQVDGAADDLNAPAVAWVEVRTSWAEKVAKAESEMFDPATRQVYVSRVVNFRLHWTSDLTETDRLVCEGLTYDIHGIRELGEREGIEVTAEARA
jgi:head-tail adaptor